MKVSFVKSFLNNKCKVSNYVVVVNRVILLDNIVSATDAVALIFSGYDKQRSNHNKVCYIHIKS